MASTFSKDDIQIYPAYLARDCECILSSDDEWSYIDCESIECDHCDYEEAYDSDDCSGHDWASREDADQSMLEHLEQEHDLKEKEEVPQVSHDEVITFTIESDTDRELKRKLRI